MFQQNNVISMAVASLDISRNAPSRTKDLVTIAAPMAYVVEGIQRRIVLVTKVKAGLTFVMSTSSKHPEHEIIHMAPEDDGHAEVAISTLRAFRSLHAPSLMTRLSCK